MEMMINQPWLILGALFATLIAGLGGGNLFNFESYFSQPPSSSRVHVSSHLPQENWCCFRLTIIIRLGVIYVYICIDCQSSILSHMVPELINNLICWNCKGCIGKSIGPVQYRFTIPSLLAQCHVAGSMPRCWLSAS